MSQDISPGRCPSSARLCNLRYRRIMSTYTTPAKCSQPWWSPSALHDLLTMMAPDGTVPSSVASSSTYTMESAESGIRAAAPSAASSPRTPSCESDTLAQYWRPCTGDLTIGSCLDAFQLPVSYRDLVYRWEEAGSPSLRSFRVPLGVHMQNSTSNTHGNSPLDLHSVTELQERAVIAAVEEYFQHGVVASQNQLFVHFASYLDIYSSVYVELLALQEGWNLEQQKSAYTSTWRSLLDAFDRDRSQCASRETHDCLNQLLWGEVHAWPVAEIKRCFKEYKMRSPASKRRPATSVPASPRSRRHRRDVSTHFWAEGVESSRTPYLSSSSSSSCGSSSESVTALTLSPSVDESTTAWTRIPTMHSSPIITLPASASYDGISPMSVEPNAKRWPDSSLMLQSVQMATGLDTSTGSRQAVKRRHSRSSSYPAPMQLSHPQSGLPMSQSDSSLNASAAGSPQCDNAFSLMTQRTRDMQNLQEQLSAASFVTKDQWQHDASASWMQHYQVLLQDAAVQLDTAAQLLSAKAMRLRCCSADQEQWQPNSADAFTRPTMRRHHTVNATIQ